MENGDIPRNDNEMLADLISMTHPAEFTLDRKYENQIVLDNYNNGISTLNDTTTKLYNRSADDTLDIQAQEQLKFLNKVKEVAEKTGLEVNTVMQSWRNQNKPTEPSTIPLTTTE